MRSATVWASILLAFCFIRGAHCKIDWTPLLNEEPTLSLSELDPIRLQHDSDCAARQLAQRIVKPHVRKASKPLTIVILGAGPIGLLAAVTLALQGHHVQVYEKRQEYSRDIWFDIYSEPWSQATQKLEDFGFFQLASDKIDYERHQRQPEWRVDVTTVRCKSLEVFMMVLAYATGVQIYYGEALTIEEVKSKYADLLVDASGSSAAWAKEAPRLFKQTPLQLRWNNETFEAPGHGVYQWTWLATFASCAADIPQNDPFYIGADLAVHEIVATYRREFAQTCEVQVLFRQNVQDEETALAIIHERVLPHFTDGPPLSSQVLKLEITHRVHSKDTILTLPGDERPLLVLGDASVPAYYRLGIGLTAGFEQIAQLGDNDLLKNPPLLQASLQRIQADHAQFQATIMAIETLCPSSFIGFDLAASNMHQAAILYRYRHADFHVVPIQDCFSYLTSKEYTANAIYSSFTSEATCE